jgi:predicted permease
MGPVGKERSWIVVILLSIVTLGIYGLYWQYAMFKEMKDHSGNGLGGGLGLVLTFITGGIVGLFVIPNEVGALYKAKGQEAPVSWLTAFWVLVPFVGGLIYLAKVQNRMNDYWGSIPPLTEGFAAPAAPAV